MLEGIVIPWWFYPLLAWTLIWKGLAMWNAAKNNQFVWFVVCFVLNTAGILPILYLAFFQKNMNLVKKVVVKKKKSK